MKLKAEKTCAGTFLNSSLKIYTETVGTSGWEYHSDGFHHVRFSCFADLCAVTVAVTAFKFTAINSDFGHSLPHQSQDFEI